MKMIIPYNVKGKECRELAQAVSEALKTIHCYKGVPSILDRQDTLYIRNGLDGEAAIRLLTTSIAQYRKRPIKV